MNKLQSSRIDGFMQLHSSTGELSGDFRAIAPDIAKQNSMSIENAQAYAKVLDGRESVKLTKKIERFYKKLANRR